MTSVYWILAGSNVLLIVSLFVQDYFHRLEKKELHDRLMAKSLQDFYHSSNSEPIKTDGKPNNFLKRDIMNAYQFHNEE